MPEQAIEEINSLVISLANLLVSQKKTLAVAESCTGGWLAKALTDVAGSSAWFLGGVVSYSNEAKSKLLTVPMEMIKQYGAVSEPVAKSMAIGAQGAFSSTLTMAITGIAGPLGDATDKPVGLVYFGMKAGDKEEKSLRKVFKGDRNEVRMQAVNTALLLLIEELTD